MEAKCNVLDALRRAREVGPSLQNGLPAKAKLPS